MPKVKISRTVLQAFSATEAATIAGLTLVMLNHLCRHKMVTPSGGDMPGRGRARQYTFADVLLLRIVKKLLDQGISVLRLKGCLNALQRRGGHAELLRQKYVATDGVDIYFGNGKVLEQVATGQLAFAFVIALGPVRSDISAAMSSLRAA